MRGRVRGAGDERVWKPRRLSGAAWRSRPPGPASEPLANPEVVRQSTKSL